VVTNRDPRVGSGVAILNFQGHGEIEMTDDLLGDLRCGKFKELPAHVRAGD